MVVEIVMRCRRDGVEIVRIGIVSETRENIKRYNFVIGTWSGIVQRTERM